MNFRIGKGVKKVSVYTSVHLLYIRLCGSSDKVGFVFRKHDDSGMDTKGLG